MLKHRAEYRNVQASVSTARHTVVAFAQLVGFYGELLVDLELAVGEALANSVEHGHTKFGLMVVECEFDAGVIVIEIADSGRGFCGWERTEPAPRKADSVRGFGLLIMHATMDRVHYLDGGKRVRLTKRLALPRRNATKREEA